MIKKIFPLQIIFLSGLIFLIYGLTFAQNLIFVTSSPSGAPFTLFAEDSSYLISTTTPFSVGTAEPNVNYTVVWEALSGYVPPASTTAFLPEGGEIDFNGVYIPAGAVAPPTNLVATTISAKQINLSWQDNSDNETGFIIERRFETDTIFSVVTTVGMNVTTYQDTGLASDTSFAYQLYSTTGADTSTPSNIAIATTLPLPPPPVSDFTSNITTLFSPMEVQFTDNSENADTWAWDFGDGSTSNLQNPVHLYSTNMSTTYTVTLIASNIGSASTTAKADYITIGLAPSDLVVTATTDSIFGMDLQWQDNSNNENGFEIYRQNGLGNSFSLITSLSADQSSYSDFGSDTTIGLDSATRYTYRVRGYNSDTVSEFTNDGFVYAFAEAILASPTSGFASAGQMTVNFTDQSLNATEWYWDFGDGNTTTEQNPGAYIYSSSTSAVFYVTESVNNTLGIGYETTVPIYVGQPPSDLVIQSVQTTQIDFAWMDNSDNETGFEIQREVDGGAYTYLATAPANSTTYSDTGLQTNTEYGYQIRAITSETSSDFTNMAITTTGSEAVADFSAIPLYGFSPLTVSFADASQNATNWSWDFGDSNGSNEQAPQHTYSTPSVTSYTVQLIASNAFSTNTITRANYITVGPLGTFGTLPDFKFINGSAQSNVLDLDNYTTGTFNWTTFAGNNFANPFVDSTTNMVSFSAPSSNDASRDTVSFIANNLTVFPSVVKYSSFLMQKLPTVTIDSGTFLDNKNISLASYVLPVPSTWPVQPTVQAVTSADNNKISASISTTDGMLTLQSNGQKLNRPVNIIITATPSEGSIDVDKEIVRVCEVLNSNGYFASSSDTSAYGFESVPSAPNGIPAISWLNTYNNATGVLRLTFSSTNMGVKVTPFSNYYIKTVPNTWYTVRIRLTCNATSQNNTFSPSVFAYNGIPPSQTEVSGMVAFSIPTTWTWFECPIFTTGSSLYPQFILKNLNTSLRNLYIDDIQVIEKKPAIALAYGAVKVPISIADFDSASDTTSYAYEVPPGGTITSSPIALTNGTLDVPINDTNNTGIKITALSSPGKTLTSPVTVGKGAGAVANIYSTGTLDNPLVLISAYGTSSANSPTIEQIGAFATINKLPGTGSNYQVNAAFTSSFPYIYHQLAVRASGDGHFYIDNLYPEVDSDPSPLYYWNHTLLPQ